MVHWHFLVVSKVGLKLCGKSLAAKPVQDLKNTRSIINHVQVQTATSLQKSQSHSDLLPACENNSGRRLPFPWNCLRSWMRVVHCENIFRLEANYSKIDAEWRNDFHELLWMNCYELLWMNCYELLRGFKLQTRRQQNVEVSKTSSMFYKGHLFKVQPVRTLAFFAENIT